MAAIKASVNLFALLDGDDSGDKRLADFDSQHKEASALAKKKAAPAAKPKPKMKPSPPANGAGSKAPRKNATPAVAAGFRSASAASAPRKSVAPPVPAGLPSTVAASSTARATDKQTTPPTAPALARGTNLTAVLFGKAYPSARERIFKQRQEEFQRKQRQEEFERKQMQEEFERKKAKAAENASDGGKDAASVYTGKTHGVRVQKGGAEYMNNGAKQAPAPPATEEPVVAPVVPPIPLPPPSIDDIAQFPSLK